MPNMGYSAWQKMLLIAPILLMAMSNTIFSQPEDSSLIHWSDGDFEGYQMRESDILYEGYYQEPTSFGGKIKVISFLQTDMPGQWEETTVLTIHRPPIPIGLTDSLLVRAVAKSSVIHYRMDAWFQGLTFINWEIGSFLQHRENTRKLTPSDIGLFGWVIRYNTMNYIPLKLSVNNASMGKLNNTCELILRTAVALRGYIYFLSHLGTNQTDTIRNIETPVMADSLIRIPVPLDRSGELSIEFHGYFENLNEKVEGHIPVILPKSIKARD